MRKDLSFKWFRAASTWARANINAVFKSFNIDPFAVKRGVEIEDNLIASSKCWEDLESCLRLKRDSKRSSSQVRVRRSIDTQQKVDFLGRKL
jgi:hypothetical protein